MINQHYSSGIMTNHCFFSWFNHWLIYWDSHHWLYPDAPCMVVYLPTFLGDFGGFYWFLCWSIFQHHASHGRSSSQCWSRAELPDGSSKPRVTHRALRPGRLEKNAMEGMTGWRDVCGTTHSDSPSKHGVFRMGWCWVGEHSTSILRKLMVDISN